MKNLMQRVRYWLIKRLGGYTAKEYDTVTKIPVQSAIPIETRKDTVTVFCSAFMRDMRGHDFCSYGERRSDAST